MENALEAGPPLRLGVLNAAPPVDQEVAHALLDFFGALAKKHRVVRTGQQGSISLPVLVQKHLDSAVKHFFARHITPNDFQPVAPSAYATGGAGNIANDAERIAREMNNVYLRRRVASFSQDGFGAEETMYALSDAFDFVREMPVRSRRLPIATDGRRPCRKRTRHSPLESLEHCTRCEKPTERYTASIQPPTTRITSPGAESRKIRWRKFEIVVHKPLPEVIRPGSAKFCAGCKPGGADYDTANERQFDFSSLLHSVELYRLMREHGAGWTSDTIRRVARILSRPKVKDAVASIASTLKRNAAYAHQAIEEFFGLTLPDDIGIARGEISLIGAATGIGVFVESAVMGTDSSPRRLNVNIDSDQVQRSIDRAASWCGLRSGLRAIAIDLPDLGLVLTANVGDHSEISAYIDRAANYEWIPSLDTAVVRAIVRRARQQIGTT